MRRYVAAAIAMTALLAAGCSGNGGAPGPRGSGATANAEGATPTQIARRDLPDLNPPTDQSVTAFSDILMENTLNLKQADRVDSKEAFNVDPALGTCGEADTGAVGSEQGRMAVKYCEDGRLIYSLDGLRRTTEGGDGDLGPIKSIMMAFVVYMTVKQYEYTGKDPKTDAATEADVKLAYCTHGYMYGGLIKGGYIGTEADLDWSLEKAYAGDLSAQRIYRNARDNGECTDPGPDGRAPDGDRANVEVTDPCGLVDVAELKRQTGATTKIPDTEGERRGRVCRLYYADTDSPLDQETTWELIVTKLENNVAAMQLCAPGDPSNLGVKTYERPGGVVQTVQMQRIFTGSACVRNYVVTLTVLKPDGWDLDKMLAATDQIVTRINAYA